MTFKIEDVVDVSVVYGDRPLSIRAFDVPLLVVSHNLWDERARIYTDLDGVAADGFVAGSPTYKMVADLFSGVKKPNKVILGRRELTDYRLTFTAQNSTAYTINLYVDTGSNTYTRAYTYTSDSSATTSEISAGLAALIEADGDLNASVAASDSSGTLVIAPQNTGRIHVGAVTTNMTISATSPEVAATAIGNIEPENDEWFFILSPSHSSTDIQSFAEYASANKRIYFTSSQEAAIFTSSTVDIASILNSASYDNVVMIAHKSADKEWPEAAALGSVASAIPGIGNLYAKTLVGVPVDTLTATELSYVEAKEANGYPKRGGLGFFEKGVVASGRFFDVIHGAFWLEARMEEDVFGEIKRVSDLSKTIPYTDEGVQQVSQVMAKRLEEAVRNGFLASYEIFPPNVEDIATNDKANRFLPDIPFEAILAGSIHTIKINGYVRV